MIQPFYFIGKEIEKQQLCSPTPSPDTEPTLTRAKILDYLSDALILPLMKTETLQLDWFETEGI